jgi:hypothetical protein
MAERRAIASGNSNSTATWDGGTLPTSDDDVYANGYIVTVNESTTWKTVRTTAGTIAVAGGNFTLSNGVTLTLTGSGNNVITGTTTCINYSGTSPNQATLVGNVVASASNTSAHGVNVSQTGTLNLVGDATGGGGIGAIGVVWSNGTVVVTGNATAGAGSGSEGLRCQGTGTLLLTGNVLGSSATATAGVRFTGNGTATINGNITAGAVSTAHGVNWPVTGTLTINGNVVGGPTATTVGVLSSSSGTVIVNGDVTGGTNATAYGASNTGTGTMTVNGKVVSNVAPGINGSITGTTTVAAAETGATCITPLSGKVAFINLSTATFGVRDSSGTLKTLKVGGSSLAVFNQKVIS